MKMIVKRQSSSTKRWCERERRLNLSGVAKRMRHNSRLDSSKEMLLKRANHGMQARYVEMVFSLFVPIIGRHNGKRGRKEVTDELLKNLY